jgi:hypothetical protein
VTLELFINVQRGAGAPPLVGHLLLLLLRQGREYNRTYNTTQTTKTHIRRKKRKKKHFKRGIDVMQTKSLIISFGGRCEASRHLFQHLYYLSHRGGEQKMRMNNICRLREQRERISYFSP